MREDIIISSCRSVVYFTCWHIDSFWMMKNVSNDWENKPVSNDGKRLVFSTRFILIWKFQYINPWSGELNTYPNIILTFSQTSPGFYVSAVQVFF